MRSPAIYVIKNILERGGRINAYDPKATIEAKTYYLKGLNVEYFESKYDAAKDTDALIILTEWKEFRSPNFNRLKSLLKNKIIFDGRNIYSNLKLEIKGWEYQQIGKASNLNNYS